MFLDWMQSTISRLIGLPNRNLHWHTSTYDMAYSGRFAVLLHLWCYGNNPKLFLERKRKKLENYLSIYPYKITYEYNNDYPYSKYILDNFNI
jgi:hypothetical protein